MENGQRNEHLPRLLRKTLALVFAQRTGDALRVFQRSMRPLSKQRHRDRRLHKRGHRTVSWTGAEIRRQLGTKKIMNGNLVKDLIAELSRFTGDEKVEFLIDSGWRRDYKTGQGYFCRGAKKELEGINPDGSMIQILIG